MTCPGCSQEGVALIGGFCGFCSTTISRAVNDALDDIELDIDLAVYDVCTHKDGFIHVMLYDDEEGVPDL